MCFPEKVDGGALFQKVATGIGSLLCLNYGVLFGITSSNIILYQSANSPLVRIIDNEAASNISAYLCLGGLVGSLVFGLLSDRIGPKTALLLCGLLQIMSWFCILFGYNIDHIYSSRIAGGLAAGGAFTVLPIYIKDISEEKNKPFLEAIIELLRNVGILVGFLLTSSAPYEYLPIIGLCISFMFNMFFPFMPESPYYLMRIGEISLMEKSLRWLRGIRKIDDRNKPEFIDELKNTFGQEVNSQATTIGNIKSSKGNFLRLIIVSIVLVITNQFCGIFLIFNYADTIFKNLNYSSTTTQWATITLAGSQLVGSLFNILLQGKLKRKTLLVLTTFLSGVSLISLATLMTYNNVMTAQEMEYIALGILTVFILIANIGFNSLTFVVISDNSTEKIRGKAITLSRSLMWFLGMVIVKFYYICNDSIGFAGLLWVFGGSCMFGFFLLILCLPESHCKTDSAIDGIGSWKNQTQK
ncbi:facilitated trehalose transporter Tret1 [Eupeodes corollae]|uniref:facilitated trehalose transporter Tret1 n=1 Tax=Eupeodes corollae TaxID=290404 RepID=UPI0024919249|nr:facilitated trehalose transporter Tret1 [Eupeodes corollae]